MSGTASRTPQKKPNRKKLAINITIMVLSVILLFVGIGCLYVDHMLGLIHIETDPPVSSQTSSPTSSTVSGEIPSSSTIEGDPTMVNGLYHDDAIMNILVLGVDDYQENDVGRSDSMILVSIDTRHQKLKMTSIMRDLYVTIPNHGSNRINSAYSIGGAPLTVQTIESNFGFDIDRWVVVDFDAFTHIIDRLGGVTITVTDGEARLVNSYSGEDRSKRLNGAGTYRLTGKQARYYSRIRAIGDDFERTERQRKVMSSIINEFKSSDLGTINGILYFALQEIYTNISKNEILSLAANSLTYMNYPISQNRLPVDGGYSNAKATIGGIPGNDVLVPDLRMNAKEIAEFIYEDDLPGRITSGN